MISIAPDNANTYDIEGVQFKMKRLSLGIKRKGTSLVAIITFKINELSALGKKYLGDPENNHESHKVKVSDADAYSDLCINAERMNNVQSEVFQKAEDFFRLVLVPVSGSEADYEMLNAENISISNVNEVVSDFLSSAGILTKPAIS